MIVFAAPSGAGKTTIIHEVMRRLPHLTFSISSTTRKKKNGERDGVDYDFITDDEFDAALAEGDFVEHEIVHGKRYGTRYSRVRPLLEEGRDVVFDLDVLGALRLKSLFPDALLIYIDVLSTEVLRQRLTERGREDAEEIELRLKRYELERSKADEFDVLVVNDDLERAIQEVVDLIRAHTAEGSGNGSSGGTS
jgi:guanylate kinase